MFRRLARSAVVVPANPGRAREIAPGDVDASTHVRAIRRGWEAFNRRDFDGAVRYLHPEGEAFPAAGRRDRPGRGDRGPLRGREEVSRFLQKVSAAWQRVTVDLREVTAAPDGRLLAVESWHMQDRNGIEFDTMVITIYAFRDGLVARLHGFLDRPTALEALARRNEGEVARESWRHLVPRLVPGSAERPLLDGRS
jgi:ketosteroid isomerase-like protein